jgi:hypothetical protein
MTSNRESKDALIALAEEYMAQVEFTQRGKHVKVLFRYGRISALMFIGSTPSDVRAIHNNSATARRLLREMTQTAQEGMGRHVDITA